MQEALQEAATLEVEPRGVQEVAVAMVVGTLEGAEAAKVALGAAAVAWAAAKGAMNVARRLAMAVVMAMAGTDRQATAWATATRAVDCRPAMAEAMAMARRDQ